MVSLRFILSSLRPLNKNPSSGNFLPPPCNERCIKFDTSVSRRLRPRIPPHSWTDGPTNGPGIILIDDITFDYVSMTHLIDAFEVIEYY